ncbi:7143_t:CDS:1, partial [Dentiscutata heterogama]
KICVEKAREWPLLANDYLSPMTSQRWESTHITVQVEYHRIVKKL